MGKHAQEVATQVAHLCIVGSGTRENEQQRTTETHQNASRLFACNRLLQNQGRQNHGEDGHRSGHDARIDGRCDAEPDGVTTLIEHKTEKACQAQMQYIFHWRMLLLHKE